MNLTEHHEQCVREAKLADAVTPASTPNRSILNPNSTTISPKIHEVRARHKALRTNPLTFSNPDHGN
jgi:hypothetical protein